MTATEILDVHQVRLLVLETIDRYPTHVNPRNDRGFCLYNSDAPEDCPHCLVGQLATDQGWPLPSDNSGGAHGVAVQLHWPIDDAAGWFLSYAQQIADSSTREDPLVGDGTWGSIRDEVANHISVEYCIQIAREGDEAGV